MDVNDLLKELGLDGPDPGERAGPLEVAPAEPGGPASPHALKLDRWDVHRGGELREANPSTFERLPETLPADLLAAAYLRRPEFAERCEDPGRAEFLRAVLDSPDFAGARGLTVGNLPEARAAALALADRYPRPKPHPKGKPGPGDPGSKAGDEAEEALVAGTRAGAEAASAAVEMRETLTAACGMGPGGRGNYDPARAAALYKMARTNPRVRKIVEYAGVFRRVGLSKRSMRTNHGYDDVVGVTTGGDVARLLPQELAKLRNRRLRLDTLRRIAERQCFVREHAGVEPAGKGPVILVVDSSGSMLWGDKLESAKGLCLAMAFLARTQRRWVGLVDYSGDTGHRLLALPPGRWPDDLVAHWMASHFGGGSNLDVPVREMPRFYELLGAPAGKTDVVFFTDAVCHIPGAVRDAFNVWKRKVRAKVTTLVIQGQPGDLAAVSEEVFVVPALAPDGDAVGKVLTL